MFQAAQDQRYIDTAASCTLAVLQRDRLEVIQAGDTRGYLLRNGRLTWISQGASPDGYSGPNASRPPPLGVPTPALPPLYTYDLRLGDTVVLCSRGIAVRAGATAAPRPGRSGSPDLETAARAILDAALAQRAEHNLTVVLAAPLG